MSVTTREPSTTPKIPAYHEDLLVNIQALRRLFEEHKIFVLQTLNGKLYDFISSPGPKLLRDIVQDTVQFYKELSEKFHAYAKANYDYEVERANGNVNNDAKIGEAKALLEVALVDMKDARSNYIALEQSKQVLRGLNSDPSTNLEPIIPDENFQTSLNRSRSEFFEYLNAVKTNFIDYKVQLEQGLNFALLKDMANKSVDYRKELSVRYFSYFEKRYVYEVFKAKDKAEDDTAIHKVKDGLKFYFADMNDAVSHYNALKNLEMSKKGLGNHKLNTFFSTPIKLLCGTAATLSAGSIASGVLAGLAIAASITTPVAIALGVAAALAITMLIVLAIKDYFAKTNNQTSEITLTH